MEGKVPWLAGSSPDAPADGRGQQRAQQHCSVFLRVVLELSVLTNFQFRGVHIDSL